MPRSREKKAKIDQVIDKEQENKEIYVAPFLQQEIISEILSYLPVDSLLRCKCINKLWCSIVQEPKFIRKHLSRAKCVEYHGDIDDVSGHEEIFDLITALDGLVLEKSRVANKYRIRNPATKQVLSLPDPDPDDLLMSMSMFYVPSIQDYKLVCFNVEIASSNVFCKLLTVGDDLTWRSLNIPSLQDLWSKNEKVFKKCSGDAFYVVRIVEPESGDSEVIYIDVETESFSSVKIPQGFFSDWTSVQPMLCDEKLALASILKEKLHVWVLEDYKKNKWAERKMVVPLTFMKDFPNAIEKLLPRTITGSQLLIDVNHESLIFGIDCEKLLYTYPKPSGKALGYIRPSAIHLKGMRPQ